MGKIQQERVIARMYYAEGKNGCDAFKDAWDEAFAARRFNGLVASSLYERGEGAVLYLEGCGVSPADIFGPLDGAKDLCGFGFSGQWQVVPEVFSYVERGTPGQWKRDRSYEPRMFEAALRPECISEYLYYHFQLREEGLAEGIMHSSIALSGSRLLMYDESPYRYGEKYCGRLHTRNTPSAWLETMTPLFILNGGNIWSDLKLLRHYYL